MQGRGMEKGLFTSVFLQVEAEDQEWILPYTYMLQLGRGIDGRVYIAQEGVSQQEAVFELCRREQRAKDLIAQQQRERAEKEEREKKRDEQRSPGGNQGNGEAQGGPPNNNNQDGADNGGEQMDTEGAEQDEDEHMDPDYEEPDASDSEAQSDEMEDEEEEEEVEEENIGRFRWGDTTDEQPAAIEVSNPFSILQHEGIETLEYGQDGTSQEKQGGFKIKLTNTKNVPCYFQKMVVQPIRTYEGQKRKGGSIEGGQGSSKRGRSPSRRRNFDSLWQEDYDMVKGWVENQDQFEIFVQDNEGKQPIVNTQGLQRAAEKIQVLGYKRKEGGEGVLHVGAWVAILEAAGIKAQKNTMKSYEQSAIVQGIFIESEEGNKEQLTFSHVTTLLGAQHKLVYRDGSQLLLHEVEELLKRAQISYTDEDMGRYANTVGLTSAST